MSIMLLTVSLIIIAFLAGWCFGKSRKNDGTLTINCRPDSIEFSKMDIQTDVDVLINKKHLVLQIVKGDS